MNDTDKILTELKELSIEFNSKLSKLHAKIDLLIKLLSESSNEPTSPNPYGDDDYATPT